MDKSRKPLMLELERMQDLKRGFQGCSGNSGVSWKLLKSRNTSGDNQQGQVSFPEKTACLPQVKQKSARLENTEAEQVGSPIICHIYCALDKQ